MIIDTEKIKAYFISAGIGAAIASGIFIFVMAQVPKLHDTSITVTNFCTVSNIMPIYDYIPTTSGDPCLAIVRRYNILLDSYKLFLGAQPRYLSNASAQCIDFALASNTYRMCVRVDTPIERPYWTFGAVYMISGGIGISAGVGWYIIDVRAIAMSGLPTAWKPDFGCMASLKFNF